MEDACTKGPRRWNWFIVGLIVLTIGIFAAINRKIMYDEYTANLEGDNKDYAAGRLPLFGFEAFQHDLKRKEAWSRIATLDWVGLIGVFGGLMLLAYGLTRKPGQKTDVDRYACPECGEPIAVTARVCRFCSAMLLPQERPRRRFGK
jgi:multisubunit Na+/H+ antiporter MnhB subunit